MDVRTTYVYQGDITEPEKETIVNTVEFNLNQKMTSYLNKLKKNEDTVIQLRVAIEKNPKEGGARYGFNGKFDLTASGSEPLRYEREDFTQLTDLINHAFERFKETLASK